jgi:hypothetical protein
VPRVTEGAPALPADLVDFLESGVSILVGTRDASLRPETLRAMGAVVDPGRSKVTLYVPQATGKSTLANLVDNGLIAVTFSRALDHRSIQIKGPCTRVRESDETDRAHQERYRALFIEGLAIVGLPRRISERAAYWPSMAVDIAVTELYEQTPGPQAGVRLVS